jgi:hypothetical protein
VAGLGIAAMLTGAGLYASASSAAANVKESVDEFEKLRYAAMVKERDNGATISLAIGAALSAGGAALIGVGAHKYRQARSQGQPVQAAVLPVSGGAALLLGGSF